MKEIIRFIKRLFRQHESGYEYWIRRDQIKISPGFRSTDIRKEKYNRKLNYWHETGEFESKIILDRNYQLIDGYSSFRIAELNGIDKVPVYFVE